MKRSFLKHCNNKKFLSCVSKNLKTFFENSVYCLLEDIVAIKRVGIRLSVRSCVFEITS